MSRDDSKAKKQRWADWINAALAGRGWNPADLVEASGGALIYNTVYNWTRAGAVVTAETALVVADTFGLPPSEVLEAASFPILAAAMADKTPRPAGDPPRPVDPVIKWILENPDFPDDIKPMIIDYHRKRMQLAAERAEYDTRTFGEALAEKREAG